MRIQGGRGYATCCKAWNIAPEASFAAIFLSFHHQPLAVPFYPLENDSFVAKTGAPRWRTK